MQKEVTGAEKIVGHKLKVVQMSEEYIEQCIELLKKSYNKLNPMYVALKLTDEQFYKFQRPVFEDKENYPISFLVIDPSENNKLVGIRINKDFSRVPKEAPAPIWNDAKLDYKEMIDYRMYLPELKKDWQPGQAISNILWCIDPDCAGKGLGKLMNWEDARILYFHGYNYMINIQYNKVSTQLALKAGVDAEIIQHIELVDEEVGGEKIFAENTDGATLCKVSLNDEILQRIGLGHLIEEKKVWLAERQKEQAQN